MQPTQDFNAENLLWMKGKRLPPTLRANAPTTREAWRTLAEETERRILDGTFRYQGLFSSESSGKKTLSTSSIPDALVLRKINSNIRRSYGLRQTQRASAVRLAREALGEWTPKGVIALDLKSCFETIAPSQVLAKLKKDAKISSQTIVLLEQFLLEAKVFGTNRYGRGLARGILISSTLAELYLSDVDLEISSIPGVYVYTRYVDDILLLSSVSSNEVFEPLIEIITAQGLTINQAKFRKRDAGCSCAFVCSHAIGTCPCKKKCKCIRNDFENFEYVDYLGYRIIFRTGKDLTKTTTCPALIAPRKMKKIKSRIEASIMDFKLTRDFGLLLDRITFLTSNVLIDSTRPGGKLRSGIAFTYSEYEEPSLPHPYQDLTLSNLDKFLYTRLRILARGRPLSYMQKSALMNRSFSSAYFNRIRSDFLPERANQIKACW